MSSLHAVQISLLGLLTVHHVGPHVHWKPVTLQRLQRLAVMGPFPVQRRSIWAIWKATLPRPSWAVWAHQAALQAT